MNALALPPGVDLDPQLLRDALTVLDHYSAAIPDRDPTKSLNADPTELLGRVRAALKPLILHGGVRQHDVANVVQRIDDVLAAECAAAQRKAPIPRMLG